MFCIDLNSIATLLIGVLCGIQLSLVFKNNMILLQVFVFLGIAGAIIKMILLNKTKRRSAKKN